MIYLSNPENLVNPVKDWLDRNSSLDKIYPNLVRNNTLFVAFIQ